MRFLQRLDSGAVPDPSATSYISTHSFINPVATNVKTLESHRVLTWNIKRINTQTPPGYLVVLLSVKRKILLNMKKKEWFS